MSWFAKFYFLNELMLEILKYSQSHVHFRRILHLYELITRFYLSLSSKFSKFHFKFHKNPALKKKKNHKSRSPRNIGFLRYNHGEGEWEGYEIHPLFAPMNESPSREWQNYDLKEERRMCFHRKDVDKIILANLQY